MGWKWVIQMQKHTSTAGKVKICTWDVIGSVLWVESKQWSIWDDVCTQHSLEKWWGEEMVCLLYQSALSATLVLLWTSPAFICCCVLMLWWLLLASVSDLATFWWKEQHQLPRSAETTRINHGNCIRFVWFLKWDSYSWVDWSAC